MNPVSRDIDPLVLRNGVYPHATFVKPRRRRRRLYLKLIDWGGIVAVAALLGAMFVFAVAALLGAFWVLLLVLEAVVRRFEG